MPDQRGLEVFNSFPEIKTLGAARIQCICDSWLQSPIAKEFAISKLDVTSEGSEILLSFSCDYTHRIEDGDETHFPMDELLFYIADNGVTDDSERATLKERIVSARQRGGPDVYRRFILRPGPRLPLYITCQNPDCQNLMVTQLRHYRNERFEYDPSSIECPRCHRTYEYDHNHFHFGPNA